VKHGVLEGVSAAGEMLGMSTTSPFFWPVGVPNYSRSAPLHTGPIAVTGAFHSLGACAGAAKEEQNQRPCGQDYLACALSRPAGLVEDNRHIGSAVERTRQSRPISKARIRDAM